MRTVVFILVGLLFNLDLLAQGNGTATTRRFSIPKAGTVEPAKIPDDYNPSLYNLEAPSPDGNSVKSFLLRQKMKQRALHPVKKGSSAQNKTTAPTPTIGQQFPLLRYVGSLVINITGGLPNDNTMAVSDDGIVVVGMNSLIYAHDLNLDTAAFLPGFVISLKNMANGNTGENYYDPKLMYDRENDRFILVFLKDNDPGTSQIVVCFSTTNNPNDPWNMYRIPGNPLNNNRWTDFPALSMTDTDLFITANLIIPNVSWQVGFDGSIVWQIEKMGGYNGDTTLNTVFHSGITYGGKYVRNLHPVQGADGAVDELYLLSNRNFALSNDSIFIAHIQGASTDSQQVLSMDVRKSNLNYGVPPNGRQFDTDINDTTSGLQTNDARVLGAIKMGEDVQFVSTSVNPATGYAAIYHGTIEDIAGQATITANIIGDTVKDFAYPNIAWVGNEECDKETVIGFNYTSFNDFPGTSCIYYSNDGNYSAEQVIKEGENYVDRLSGTYERWGDYYGLQRMHNKPGSAFSFGFYALQDRRNTGWGAELISPDNSIMGMTISRQNPASTCTQEITVNVSGGLAPFSYNWSNDPNNLTATSTGMCLGDSATVTVTDARGCTMSRIVYGEIVPISEGSTLYPNPFSSSIAVQFTLDADKSVTARIYDLSGKLVADLIQRNASAGLNELSFSLTPLAAGKYILIIEADGKEIINEKIIKYEQ